MGDEQGENLKDIPGFDPNVKDSAYLSGDQEMSNVLTPLQKAARASGKSEEELRQEFLHNIIVRLSEGKDPDNLFSIYKSARGCERVFWKYDQRSLSSSFKTAIKTITLSTSDAYQISTEYLGEANDREAIYFFGVGMNIYKMISNDRIVNVNYDKAGKLKKVSFGIASGDRNYGIEFDDQEQKFTTFVTEPLSIDVYGSSRHPRHLIPPELEFGVKKDGVVDVLLSKKGKETDRFSVPQEIDIEGVKADMYPDELLKNPTNPDINLDTGAFIPPFARIGAKWEVLEEEKRPMPTQEEVENF